MVTSSPLTVKVTEVPVTLTVCPTSAASVWSATAGRGSETLSRSWNCSSSIQIV